MHTRHAFKASNAVCCRPHKGGSLPRHGHRGLCQICKIFNKSVVISDKANKLSDTFDLIRGMPVLYCRQLRWVTRQAHAAHNMSQENHFRLHFLAFSCKPKLLRRHSTSSRRPRAPVTVPPNEITSKLHQASGPTHPTQNTVHQPFECRRSITQSEWHHPKLEQPFIRHKRSFAFSLRRHGNLPISTCEVHCGKPLLVSH